MIVVEPIFFSLYFYCPIDMARGQPPPLTSRSGKYDAEKIQSSMPDIMLHFKRILVLVNEFQYSKLALNDYY